MAEGLEGMWRPTRVARYLRDITFYRRFRKIRSKARGMLSAKTYAAIYEAVYAAADLDIIEIGARGGAASIAIAKALIDSGKSSKLVVVEKCEGSNMSEFGEYAENLKHLESIFEHFGVRDRIEIFPHHLTHENGDQVIALIETNGISCLMHDADGMIGRDISLFWPMLVEGGLVIIDDYIEARPFRPVSDSTPLGGTKEMRTFRLANQLIDWGLIEPNKVIDRQTLFAIKPQSARFEPFDPEVIDQIIDDVRNEYRVWANSRGLNPEWREFS